MRALRKAFRPEFINRLDEIIVFNRLDQRALTAIAELGLKAVSERAEALGITLRLTKDVASLIAEKGYDPLYGARPMRRAITGSVEDPLAERMLRREITAGDTVTVSVEDGRLLFSKSGSEKG